MQSKSSHVVGLCAEVVVRERKKRNLECGRKGEGERELAVVGLYEEQRRENT